MKKIALVFGLLTAAFTVLPVSARHSFQATYNLDTTIEIRGTLVQVNFRNPHASIMIMAPDENGDMQRWGIEWGGASLLQRQGLTRESFRAGDQVIVTGQPGRNANDHRMRMETIFRPIDEFGWGTNEGETFD